jgi:ribosome maturation factor RimP
MRNKPIIQIETELLPLLEVHGVELVALEWFQGAGRGLLRLTIDHPNGSPHNQDPALSIGIEVLTHVTRDISTLLDTLDAAGDLFAVPYQLEVTSPGPERPVQKRADFDRFAGMRARIELLPAIAEKTVYRGTLRTCLDATASASDTGEYLICLDVDGKRMEFRSQDVTRAKLEALPPPKKPEKPGKGPSRRQERIAARERARAINAAHLEKKKDELTASDAPASPGAER